MKPEFRSPVGRELLDDPTADPALVRESLHHLARSNAWFGGYWAARGGLARLLGPRRPDRLTLLDVGTGHGDIPGRLAGWCRRRGIGLGTLGIDLHPAAAALATRAGVPTAVADAFRLPFRDQSVDVVLMSQVCHHFAPPGILALAREASRVARLGVVIADLRRSVWARWGFAVGARLLRFDPVTRVDGVTSVARGFSPAGLSRLLREGGFPNTVSTHPGARVVAVWSTE